VNNSYDEKIEELLTPIVGSIIARSNVKLACDKTGIKLGEITQENLPAIAKRLELYLPIMVGQSVAKRIADKVRNL